jgi:hypothetical protein
MRACIVDGAGDYLVMEAGNFITKFWRVTPGGRVTPIPLHGERIATGSSIISDGGGNYLVGSFADSAIFRVTPAGEVTRFVEHKRKQLDRFGANSRDR